MVNALSSAPSAGVLVEAVLRHARRSPDAVAVAYGDDELTYRQLTARAGRTAAALRGRGLGRGDLVGVCLRPGTDLVTAFLAAVWAGCAYVPLDPAHPRQRRAELLRDCGARLLITDTAVAEGDPLAVSPATLVAEAGDLREPPPSASSPDDVAYVCYTSGTTGTPKGVAVPQRAVTHLVTDTDYVDLGPGDRVAQASNPAFDAATFEVWGALCNGARMEGLAKDVLVDPDALAGAIRAKGVSVLFLTTSLFHLVALERPDAFAPLRLLLTGGEALSPHRVRDVLAHPPGALLNVYGPTETTTFATWHRAERVGADDASVPIGTPLRRVRAFVLDEFLREVPDGVTGELYLAGPGLAHGYWADPVATALRFVAHPAGEGERLYRTGDRARRDADGRLDFRGRDDQQVKIRGFRVNPAEVEARAARCPGATDAVVTVTRHSPDDVRMTLYVIPAPGAGEGLVERVLARLRETLPGYAVPSAAVVLERLPLNGNGKLDRAALPPPPNTPATGAPRGPLESALTLLWAELLDVPEVGIHDDFFELGGHSLTISRLRSLITQTLGVELPLADMFDTRTVAEQAAALTLREPAPGALTAAARELLRVAALTDEEVEAELASAERES
ncbi:non-ribosomal peptide synthetase [Streptomyces somaliensis DSM 40738]|uniref:Non-ribosomal peptide synthetase n=1 Tax=Streptomyces somaliensis (strain ATCC 33201 / DSM 40738 / JCM 12659 / KCTC 9044 / NCTC 11332 / NRRL B-12077 / IP 733) TaxID=1134445 RepID=A0AA44IBZ8_STRE0|nr:non-ribosomal peptide synthetase [Streptomyces somaliensis]MCQ0024266.1 non-ribosomal peptide synthetase [Streptomyces somaliensis DSM 40738]NKY12877.1 non-ribosomal peptide synthetase [Streptomyces somaliensis DSM 40738]